MRFEWTAACLFMCSAGVTAQEPRLIETANSGFEDADANGKPANWYGNVLAVGTIGPGYAASIDLQGPAEGASSVRLESLGEPPANQFGTLTQVVDVTQLRGRKVRLTGQVRVGEAAPYYAGIWLRVSRPLGLPPLVDNMIDRPVTSTGWTTHTVEVDVALDAVSMSFGVAIGGTGQAWFDTVKIEDIGAAEVLTIEDPRKRPGPPRAGPMEGDLTFAPVSERGVANLQAFARLYGLVRWFHPSQEAMSADWTRFLIAHLPAVEAAANPEELAAALSVAFDPVAPLLEIAPGASAPVAIVPPSERHIRWKHTGYSTLPSRTFSSITEVIPVAEAPKHWSQKLPGGVSITLPLTVPVNPGHQTLPIAGAVLAPDMAKPEGWIPAGFDRVTRLAGIVSSWALLDHFYPYWHVVDTDWDAEFAPALQQAAMAKDDIAYMYALRGFTERLQDGHGNVFYRYDTAYMLPIDWAWIEGQLVVTATTADAPGVQPGMIVQAIDGKPADVAMTEAMGLISGSKHSKRYRAETVLRGSHEQGQRILTLVSAAGETRKVTLPLNRATRASWHLEERPEKLAELEPGLLYADLTRITQDDLAEAMKRFATAEAIVFDVRGYPRARSSYLAHLTNTPVMSATMKAGIQTRPDAQFDTYRDGGWTIEPAMPRYTNTIVWLTDGSAGSYPESILGTVKANGLGTIIGSATAGANGDYSRFMLPGGYQIQWTGLQVINRDGSQHHNIGVLPDIMVEPTLAGVRQGRDELLDQAIAEVKRQMTKD